MHRQHWLVTWTILALLLSASAGMQALAQGGTEPWTAPANLSQSGAASEPALISLPGGGQRVFWWDRFDGVTMAERGGSPGAPWSEPISTPVRVWQPFERPNAAGETGEYLPVEAMPHIVGDAAGRAHAFWLDAPDGETGARPLLHARLLPESRTWSTAVAVADTASGFAAAVTADGSLHLAYVRDIELDGQAAGIYSRRSTDGGAGWRPPIALAGSRYYRLLSPDKAHLDLASDEAGSVYLTWDDPRQTGIELAFSPDGGATWSDPRWIGAPPEGGVPRHGRVIPVAGQEVLLLWDVERPNGTCALYQAGARTLLEGAGEAGAPVLPERLACGQEMRFLTLEGRTTMAIEEPDGSLYTATWEGSLWRPARRLAVQFAGPEGEREGSSERVRLHDLQVVKMAGADQAQALLVAGVDDHDEVWAVEARVEALAPLLAPLAPTPTPTPRLRAPAQGEADAPAPANLSRSGAATDPAILALSDGTLRALWWDRFEGLTVAEGAIRAGETGASALQVWSDPVQAPIQHVQTAISVDPQTGQVTLRTERTPINGRPRFLAGAAGRVHAFWLEAPAGQGAGANAPRRLMHAATDPGSLYWSPAAVVAPSAAAFDVYAGEQGTLYLGYLVARETPESGAAGLYVQRSDDAGATWQPAAAVDRSPYYRLLALDAKEQPEPKSAHLRIAAGGAVYLTWDDPRTGAAQLAASTDAGLTWSLPTSWGSADATPQRGRLFVAGGQAWLMWEDAGQGGGCALYQAPARALLEGGTALAARVLEGLAACPEDARFLPLPEGGVLLVAGSGSDVLTVAAWQGGQWSEPRRQSYRFEDPQGGRPVYLGALQAALVDQRSTRSALIAAGIDTEGELWVTPGQAGALDLVFAPPSAWSPPAAVSAQDEAAVESAPGLPAMAVDGEGRVHLLWAQRELADRPETALYYARGENGSWTRPAVVLRSPISALSAGSAQEPSLAVLGERLHALWSGGSNGQIWYSRAFLRDAYAATGWEEPRPLPGPSEDTRNGFEAGSAPHLVADPWSALHAVYAVPANEGRGIYYTRSDDEGVTWTPSVALFDAASAGWAAVDTPRLAIEPSGELHAVWVRAALSPDQPPQGVYYAHSSDGERPLGAQWSEAQRMVEGAYAWPQVALSGPGQVHLLWNAAAGSRTWWHRQTAEAGWTLPQQVPGFGDVPGPVGLVVDGTGTLHLAGLGRDPAGEPALLYLTWAEGRWGPREEVRFDASETEPGVVAGAAPGEARLEVALRARSRDGQTAGPGIWHSSRAVEAAGVEAGAVPPPRATVVAAAPTREPAAETPAVPTPTAGVTPAGTLRAPGSPPPSGGELLGIPLPLVLGGGLAALIVIGIFATRQFWAGRR